MTHDWSTATARDDLIARARARFTREPRGDAVLALELADALEVAQARAEEAERETAALRANNAQAPDGSDLPNRVIEDAPDPQGLVLRPRAAIHGLVAWARREQERCTAEGVEHHTIWFRCVSEDGAIWYFDSESIVALVDALASPGRG